MIFLLLLFYTYTSNIWTVPTHYIINFYYILYELDSIKNCIGFFFMQYKNKQILTAPTTFKLSVLSLNKVRRKFVFNIIFLCGNLRTGVICMHTQEWFLPAMGISCRNLHSPADFTPTSQRHIFNLKKIIAFQEKPG